MVHGVSFRNAGALSGCVARGCINEVVSEEEANAEGKQNAGCRGQIDINPQEVDEQPQHRQTDGQIEMPAYPLLAATFTWVSNDAYAAHPFVSTRSRGPSLAVFNRSPI